MTSSIDSQDDLLNSQDDLLNRQEDDLLFLISCLYQAILYEFILYSEIPSIIDQPEAVTLVTGEATSFMCRAQGIPIPSISWIVVPSVPFTDSPNLLDDTNQIESTLSITATNIRANTNNTIIQCQATNIFNNVSSIAVLIIIAGNN